MSKGSSIIFNLRVSFSSSIPEEKIPWRRPKNRKSGDLLRKKSVRAFSHVMDLSAGRNQIITSHYYVRNIFPLV